MRKMNTHPSPRLRHILAAVAVAASATCSMSATGPGGLEWTSTEYDFGIMKEQEGPKTGEVKFVNKGSQPTLINSVRPSCGCTGASYTDGLIEPGDTATVTFTYNPHGRPGRFAKTVKVYTGENNDLTTIRISGTVIGTTETLQRDFPASIGNLRLSALEEKAGDMRYGTARHLFIRLYNQSQDTLCPKIVNPHKALSVGVNPASIPPGDVATLGLYLNSRDTTQMGAIELPIEIRVNEPEGDDATGTVTVSTNIVPDTSSMTVEEIDNAPFAAVHPELIDFGKIEKAGEQRKFKFEIANDGKTEMQVLRVYSRQKGIKIKRHPAKVKAGGHARVEGVADTGSFPEGLFRIGVEVITDDPLHPARTVTIVGENTVRK